MVHAIQQRLLRFERALYFALQTSAFKKVRQVGGKSLEGRAKPQHLLTGERGEDEAYFFLRAVGYTIVARRWRTGTLRGDLDLVGWDGDTLVVFEVKTRTARDFAAPETGVDSDKQRILRRMAAAYVRQFPERHRERVLIRFDVVSVYLLDSGIEFEHFRSAFR